MIVRSAQPADDLHLTIMEQEPAGVVVDVEWVDAISGVCAWLAAGGAAVGTVRLRRLYLQRLAHAVAPSGPWELTFDQLLAFIANGRWQPSTKRSARSSVRALYAYGMAAGKVDSDPSALLPRISVPIGLPRPAPEEVLVAAMMVADERGRLVLALAAFAGLRRAEIACVHTSEVIDGELRVHGKGGKQRLVPLHPVLVDALSRVPAGFVFPGQIDGHLSADHIGEIASRILQPGWTLHTLRHRFATRGLLAGNLRAVQELLGHSSVATTQIYTKVAADALRDAVLAAGPSAA